VNGPQLVDPVVPLVVVVVVEAAVPTAPVPLVAAEVPEPVLLAAEVADVVDAADTVALPVEWPPVAVPPVVAPVVTPVAGPVVAPVVAPIVPVWLVEAGPEAVAVVETDVAVDVDTPVVAGRPASVDSQIAPPSGIATHVQPLGQASPVAVLQVRPAGSMNVAGIQPASASPTSCAVRLERLSVTA
jgi:hypothetical protein